MELDNLQADLIDAILAAADSIRASEGGSLNAQARLAILRLSYDMKRMNVEYVAHCGR
jgi:hypothetical protein